MSRYTAPPGGGGSVLIDGLYYEFYPPGSANDAQNVQSFTNEIYTVEGDGTVDLVDTTIQYVATAQINIWPDNLTDGQMVYLTGELNDGVFPPVRMSGIIPGVFGNANNANNMYFAVLSSADGGRTTSIPTINMGAVDIATGDVIDMSGWGPIEVTWKVMGGIPS